MPTLYLIPTLLADDTAELVLPPHIRNVIEKTDAYFVENVRTARRFITGLKTSRVIDETTFFDLNKDTPPADTRRQIQELMERKRNAGVLSEAGCPGVADPGAVVVGMAHTLGWRVEPLVGPSSILLALMASGLNGQSFVFHGYLPIEKATAPVPSGFWTRKLRRGSRLRFSWKRLTATMRSLPTSCSTRRATPACALPAT